MKVRQLGVLVVALAVGALSGAANTLAANGLPSDAALAAMGLSDLRVMSDSEGLAVRGLGYSGASAKGKSFAVVAGYGAASGSTNSYDAKGKYVATGQNFSFAGIEVETGGGHGDDHGGGYGNNSKGGHGNDHGGSKPQSVSIKAFSGGSSGGFRK